jgi:hypothetical protein
VTAVKVQKIFSNYVTAWRLIGSVLELKDTNTAGLSEINVSVTSL